MRLAIVLLLIAGAVGFRHPVHSSTAELRAVGSTAIEARVRVFTNDLSAAAGESDSARIAYLRRTFLLFDEHGAKLEAAVGITSVDPAATTTFMVRASVPAGAAAVRVQHAVLWERFDDQVNIVRVRGTGLRTRKLVFLPGEAPKAIR